MIVAEEGPASGRQSMKPRSHAPLESLTRRACELFAGISSGEFYEYLLARAESPLQVPFYYLHALASWPVAPDEALREPTTEAIDLAYRVILQRPPESESCLHDHVRACCQMRQVFETLLSGPEAVAQLPRLFARAFPYAKKLWHVHIPKTAGTSFFAAGQSAGCGFINTNILEHGSGALNEIAKGVCLPEDQHRATIITGHWPLPRYMDCIGPFDRVVVFVRDPVLRAVSDFNYAVDLVRGGRFVHQADPQPFLDRGLDPASFARSYKRGFFGQNIQCSYLANDGTSAGALRNLTLCDAWLLPSDAVGDAIAECFHRARNQRQNVSNKHVLPDDLDQGLRDELLAANHHDLVLNELAKRRYHRSGGMVRRLIGAS